ncbi:TetR/AcrR family transcriptional regulator [Paenibacillus chitinolyticus]|uniref:TetR/AcrR family transcriptional regulator n=1 Tax=Paenibacillus chitinolyticus TaxID=79263 RepID=UPI0026E4AF8B|nr:TetR/AcrR family transcriptional regulator [Paenibacillus chitinolyticus]GKS10294.1 TetR family transcriptional regulator [Paenibacillus chitinolyticus]
MTKGGRPREFKDAAVIDAAMEAFWMTGYEGCSTEELCKKTGLGKGSLYNAFGSKHDLYEQVLQRYHRQGIEEQVEILRRPVSVKERLRELLDWAVKEDFSESGRRGCLLINAAVERAGVDPMVEKVAVRHIELLEKELCLLMEQGIGSEEIIAAGRTAKELANVVLSCYYGLRVLNSATRNREMARTIVEGTLAAL